MKKRPYTEPNAVVLHMATQRPLAVSGSSGPEANDQEDPTSPHKAREMRHYSVWDDEDELSSDR